MDLFPIMSSSIRSESSRVFVNAAWCRGRRTLGSRAMVDSRGQSCSRTSEQPSARQNDATYRQGPRRHAGRCRTLGTLTV